MNTDGVSKLLDRLAIELERPRELSVRVVNYIRGTYGVDIDAIGSFLVDELPKLEDYEIDLLLSPLFTPKLADQAVFAELLGGVTITRDQWPALIQDLINRPVRAKFITSDGRSHDVPLREVTIERYVHRLRLEGVISASNLELLDRALPVSDRPLLKAVARRAIWEAEGRNGILVRYLTHSVERGAYSLADALGLLNLVESLKPVNLADLLSRIPSLQEALRKEINEGSGSKPFMSPRIQEMHGGERDQRAQDDSVRSVKENELAFLERLNQILTPHD